jgi:hypothetical protein
MSGASIPYHLRPHKAVDRRLFLDLLGRLERWKPLHGHAYVSMGAYPLEDHRLVHRVLGITRLLAFDMEPEVVARQLFNRPLDSCRCIEAKAETVVGDLDRVLKDEGFGDADGAIVWLDYTDPKKLAHQLREFQTLLDNLTEGDIVRVTVNAHVNLHIEASVGAPLTKEDKRTKMFQTIKSKMGEFLPSDVSADDMTEAGLPSVISRSFGRAAHKAFQATGANMFKPLSVTRYSDGTQMLSMTGMVIARDKEDEFDERMQWDAWPFASKDWETVHHLVVPSLTLRERLFLEKSVARDAEDLIQELGFSEASEIPLRDFLASYKHYYRFYPTLLTADV